MPLLFDRMPSVDYNDPEHDVLFVITFDWGEQTNPVPEGVVVLTRLDDEIIVAATRSKSWETYEEAVEVGKQAADKFVAKYWKD